MKSQLITVENQGVTYQALKFICPGCKAMGAGDSTGLHILPVNSNPTTPSWDWNGDTEKVTLTPSILTRSYRGNCHSFLREGIFEFLSDSEHPLAGKSIPMVDLEDWMIKEQLDGK